MKQSYVFKCLIVGVLSSLVVLASGCSGNTQDGKSIAIVDESSVSKSSTNQESKGTDESSDMYSSVVESSIPEVSKVISGIGNPNEVLEEGITSLNKPANKQTWVKYFCKDYDIRVFFPAEMRVVKTTTATEDNWYVLNVITDYNDNRDVKFRVADLSPDEEFVVVDLEVRTSPDLGDIGYRGVPYPYVLSIENLPDSYDANIHVGYAGMDDALHAPGESFSTKIVFKMLKGYDDYIIKATYDRDESSSGFNYAYFSVK